MSTFMWKADEDQTFRSAYGDVVLFGKAGAFTKNSGCSFTMDASTEGHLTLQVLPEPAEPPATEERFILRWPNPESPPGTATFNIISGEFTVKPASHVDLPQAAAGAILLGKEHRSWSVDIFIEEEGIFNLYAPTQIIFDSSTLESRVRLNMKGSGQLNLESELINFSARAYRNAGGGIYENARLMVRARDTIQILGGIVEAHDTAHIILECRDVSEGHGINADPKESAGFELYGKSTMVMKSPGINLDGDLYINVNEQARLDIYCDTFQTTDADTAKAVLNLESGEPVITVQGFNGTSSAPSAVHGKAIYPQGYFNFITSKGQNRGTFILKGLGSAFEQQRLLDDGYIAIDGDNNSDYVRNMINYDLPDEFENGDLHIRLR